LLSIVCIALRGAPSARGYVIEIDKVAFGLAPEGLRVNDIIECGSFDIDLAAGAMGRRILMRIGVATHICRPHPGMNGRLGSIVSQQAVKGKILMTQ
jgi:hypothetical protein